MIAIMSALSVIIPLGPGESFPACLIQSLSAPSDQVQILLAIPEGQARPAECDVPIITCPPGRGRQQNTAASAARGHWLWFVHADCHLPPGAIETVLDFIRRSSSGLGYCRLRFASDGPALTRLNAAGANLRARWFKLPYGDQAFCLPAKAFNRLGGFREDLQRGEDLDLVVRARDAGLAIRPIGLTITTSARRYREYGWLKTTVQHQIAARRLIRQARAKHSIA